MARDHYDVLGVSTREQAHGLSSAHRDLTRRFRPERAGHRGTRRYRETQEAYGVLSDRAARSAYDRARTTAQLDLPPWLSLRRDFVDGEPPLEQVLEAIRQDFTRDLRKSGRVDTLAICVHAVESSLDLAVPVYHPCPNCHGTGAVMSTACRACDGSGALEAEERVSLSAREERVSLREIGIHSIELSVRVVS